MRLFLLVSFLMLASCGASPLSLLTGGGPNVAADVQVGKENTQQVVASQVTTQTDNKAGRDVFQQSTPIVAENIKEVTIQQTPLWMIILLVLGWLLPSPNEISRWIRSLFKK